MNPRYDVLVAGELKVDLSLDGLTGLPQAGQERQGRSLDLRLDSPAALFARAFCCLGGRAALLGRVGRDALGRWIQAGLRDQGVATGFLMEDGEPTRANLTLDAPGQRAVVLCPGAREQVRATDLTPERLAAAGHLHVASGFQQPGLNYQIPDFFRAAKEAGLSTSFDPQRDPGRAWHLELQSILPFVDILLIREGELLDLTGQTEVPIALDEIVPYARILVVKLGGGRGSLVRHGGLTLHARPFLEGEPGAAPGLSESFDAGFLFRFLQAASMEDCLTCGSLLEAAAGCGEAEPFRSPAALRGVVRARFGVDL